MEDNKEGEKAVFVVDQFITVEEVDVAETSPKMEKAANHTNLSGHLNGTEAKVGLTSLLCVPGSDTLNTLFISLHFLSTATSSLTHGPTHTSFSSKSHRHYLLDAWKELSDLRTICKQIPSCFFHQMEIPDYVVVEMLKDLKQWRQGVRTDTSLTAQQEASARRPKTR